MIGSLLYITGTRSDIVHVVGIVGWFQDNPKESHLKEIKMIFKYLQGTQDFGLWYSKNTDFALHAYTSVDWAGNVDDHKIASGGELCLEPHLVSWLSKKHSSIVLSIVEEEYVVGASCCTQLLWMIQTLQDIQFTYPWRIPIIYDNTSAISISKIPIMHSKIKYIPTKYHFLSEQVLEQKVKLEYVSLKEQVADLFTKPLPCDSFEYIKKKLGMVPAYSLW